MPRSPRLAGRAGAANPLLIGCLGVALLIVILGVIGVVWAVRNAKSIGTNIARKFVVQVVNDSKLPDDQKRGVIAHVDRLAEDYKAGRITDEQMGRVIEAIGESPIFPMAMVMWAEHHYVVPSELPPEEKAKASLDLQRFARGVYEKSIPQEAVDEVLAPLQKRDPNNPDSREMKERVTTEELRQFLANVERRADEADVPDEPFEVNFEREIGLAIEKALNPEAAPATVPAPVEATPTPGPQPDHSTLPQPAEPVEAEPAARPVERP